MIRKLISRFSLQAILKSDVLNKYIADHFGAQSFSLSDVAYVVLTIIANTHVLL